MIDGLHPVRIDNSFTGPTAAPWLLGVLVLMKLAMSLNVMLKKTGASWRHDRRPAAVRARLGSPKGAGRPLHW